MTGLVAGDKQEPSQSFVFSFLNKILLKFHMTKGGGGRRGLLDDGVQMIEMRVSEFDDAKKGRGRALDFLQPSRGIREEKEEADASSPEIEISLRPSSFSSPWLISFPS